MSFAFPSAFFWVTLCVPVILLYILKVRLRRLTVSSNMFWQQVYEEKPPRALWQKLRHWSSLLLQLLLLMLIILAVADPFLTGSRRFQRRMVLVIDNSASMAAMDVSPSRLASAKRDAMDLVDTLGPLDEAAVIVAGRNPDVACGMTGHLPTLKHAIGKISQTEGSTALEPAVELARKLLATNRISASQSVSGDAARNVFVFTDGCLNASDEGLFAQDKGNETSHIPVIPRLFGTSAANVGIIQFQSRRTLSDPIGYEVLVAIRNSGDAAVRCRLELSLNEALIDVVPLQLAPGEVWSQSIPKTSADGGVLRAELSDFQRPADSSNPDRLEADGKPDDVIQDGLLSDNRSCSILTPRPAVPVLLVTQGNLFLQKVLEATPRVELTISSEAPAQLPADFADRNGVVVFHGTTPLTVPTGNVMVIDPTNDSDLWTRTGMIEAPLITELDASSPLLTFVNLQNVSLPRVETLRFADPVRPLVTTISGDVLLGRLQRPDGRCLVLSINLNESDLGFRTAFPILVSNAITWFTSSSSDVQPVLKPDETVSVAVPADFVRESRSLVLRGPGGEARKVAIAESGEPSNSGGVEQHEVRVGPFSSVGLWSIRPSSMDERRFELAVNLADSRESDLRSVRSLEELSRGAVAQRFSGSGRPIWMSLIILACLLTCVEWMLYHRRIIE